MGYSTQEIAEALVDAIQTRQQRCRPPIFWEAFVEHDRAAARANRAWRYRVDPGFRLVMIHRARLKDAARIAAREAVRPPCPGCGVPVLRKRIDQTFCTPLCRQQTWRREARAKGKRVT